ncbi:MAG: Stp1/IreP family PP2C-type Ser/Thr phosphatase [Oscillospiraceae bacterium]|nr:Stp1/IreP family PP2C-type Ser/Thr phosphatase [Oscillospiraceae bacterium]
MKISALTDKGRVRPSNQDCFAAGSLPGGALFAVICDGMGGAAGGNVASRMSCEFISEKINKAYSEGMNANSVRNLLFAAVTTANSIVYDAAEEDGELKGMGTTVVAVIISGGLAHIVHAGDSRAYIIRGGELRQLTVDHSLVQELMDAGSITADEVKKSPYKNIITRAIGADKTIELEYGEEDFKKGDGLLLCSDGLYNFAAEEKILDIISDGNIGNKAEKLIEAANENGGGDNITAIFINE